MLVAASILSIAAIALACAGRLSALDASERAAGRAAVVNLNTVADSETLEPALSLVFTDPPDAPVCGARALSISTGTARKRPAAAECRRARPRARGNGYCGARGRPFLDLVATRGSETLVYRSDARGLPDHVLLFGLLYVLGFHIVSLVWRLRSARSDVLILVTAHLLTAIGFAAILARPDPLRDSFLVGTLRRGHPARPRAHDRGVAGQLPHHRVPRAQLCAAAGGAFAFRDPAPRRLRTSGQRCQGQSRTRPADRRHSTAARALSRRVLRASMGTAQRSAKTAIRHRRLPGWINLPRSEYVMPVAAGVGMALFFFFLQKDLGPALFTCCVFLAIYAVARGRTGMAVAGLAVLLLAFYVGHVLHVSQTLADRVGMWQSPWNNAVAGRRSDCARTLGHVDGWNLGNGSRPRGYALSAGGPHGLDPRGHRRGTGRARPPPRDGSLRDARLARLPHRAPRPQRLRVLSRHDDDPVPDSAGLHHGVGRRRCIAPHRRRHAVPELRRVGDDHQFRCARRARRRSTPIDVRQSTSPRSARRCAGSAPCSAPPLSCSSRSSSTSRSFMATTISSGPTSACRPTEACASPTTRACSTSCAQSRAGPSTIASASRSPRTTWMR